MRSIYGCLGRDGCATTKWTISSAFTRRRRRSSSYPPHPPNRGEALGHKHSETRCKIPIKEERVNLGAKKDRLCTRIVCPPARCRSTTHTTYFSRTKDNHCGYYDQILLYVSRRYDPSKGLQYEDHVPVERCPDPTFVMRYS